MSIEQNNQKIVIITGDSSGIGKSLCELYSKNNIVYGISRRVIDVPYKHYQADVLDYNRLQEISQEIYSKHKRIDLLICCAGLGVAGAFETMSQEQINKQLSINLNGVLNANKAIIPYMREQKYGRIVNISSVAAVAPMPFQALYSASKAAINSFTMALSNELKPFNIDVISIMPGDTRTGFTASRVKVFDEKQLYNARVERSITKMENDELNGTDVQNVANEIYNHINKKHPKLLYTTGSSYRFLVFLMKILPNQFVNKILYSIYAK